MTKEELEDFVKENMDELKEEIDKGINNNPDQFPFNLANELSYQNKQCDIQKLYDTIKDLNLKYRAALILRYKYKLPYRRIEEDLGYSTGEGCIIIYLILLILKTYFDIYVV
jgi:DNA-directed RNA polymerase specialized sigma24 family protein